MSLVIGTTYRDNWERYCAPTWTRYAEAHGYDVIALAEPPRPDCVLPNKSLHWQKCFVPGHPAVARYDHAVILDADIMINARTAPCIVGAMTSTRIGAVNLRDRYPHRRQFDNTVLRIELLSAAYRLKRGLATWPDGIVRRDTNEALLELQERKHRGSGVDLLERDDINTGVLVTRPSEHRRFFEELFDAFRDEPEMGSFEQIPMSRKLFSEDAVELLDPGFNTIFHFEIAEHYPFLQAHRLHGSGTKPYLDRLCCNSIYQNCYFLHFAGGLWHYMNRIDTRLSNVLELCDSVGPLDAGPDRLA